MMNIFKLKYDGYIQINMWTEYIHIEMWCMYSNQRVMKILKLKCDENIQIKMWHLLLTCIGIVSFWLGNISNLLDCVIVNRNWAQS